jgi:hypothetical protein
VCRAARVLRLLRYVGVAQWRTHGLGGGMGTRPMSSHRGLCIIGPMWALASSREYYFDSLPLYYIFKLEHCIIYVYLLQTKKNYVINLYSGHECVVLCVNASVLAPRMDPG